MLHHLVLIHLQIKRCINLSLPLTPFQPTQICTCIPTIPLLTALLSSYNLRLFVRHLVPHPPISNQYRLLSVIVPPLSSGITSFPRITVASPSPGTGSYSILPAARYFPTVPTPVHIPAITAILTPRPPLSGDRAGPGTVQVSTDGHAVGCWPSAPARLCSIFSGVNNGSGKSEPSGIVPTVPV